jgi:hypothetical protein
MFNEQLRDVLRKGEQTLVKVFNGANGGKLNDAQQLACMQYIDCMNDGVMGAFANPQVESEEKPRIEAQAAAPATPDTAPAAPAAPDVETAKVKEMTKDAVAVASGKEQSRAQQQGKDSGVGAEGKRKKK